MNVTRILHHSVNVEGSLEPTIEFYRSLFSLDDADRPDIPGVGGHWFTVGDAQIHLVDARAGDDPIRPTGPHDCFGVEDLEAAVDELEARGIAYLRGNQGPVVQVWFNDPAGHTIEIQQETWTR
ncbi:MAG TPA: VOC family protein [Acidimicrobiales bacterium]|jgi:catechol 2,3-dioxygenase-like lactoylglutathione lyase family enzyme|nr:VOC family protein [Acidimicrobiales bacterium]